MKLEIDAISGKLDQYIPVLKEYDVTILDRNKAIVNLNSLEDIFALAKGIRELGHNHKEELMITNNSFGNTMLEIIDDWMY